jgi:hypothetical protein
MTDARTCAACAPYSIRKCGAPVVGRSNKRFCSRTCQNRDYKERWRHASLRNRIAPRLRERHAKAVKRSAERHERNQAERREFTDWLAA